MCLLTLVKTVITNSPESYFPPRTTNLQTWFLNPPLIPISSSNSTLLNLTNFQFLLNNASKCSGPEPIFFIILVHSAPLHFSERQTIRETWGSITSLKGHSIRLIFLLGVGTTNQAKISEESQKFGDIVLGSFTDSYRNLTYKHLMGYKWVLTYCPHPSFILKTDDDAFIDLFQLFRLVTSTYGAYYRESSSLSSGVEKTDTLLLCNVFPQGTPPVRFNDTKGIKWSVTREEYPFSEYPKYCGGLAYIATPSVVEQLYNVSAKVKFLWIDDVFVTGVIREIIGVEPYYMNLRYTYEPQNYRKWLQERKTLRKIPFMIVHVERGRKLKEEMQHLWNKSVRVWRPTFGIIQ